MLGRRLSNNVCSAFGGAACRRHARHELNTKRSVPVQRGITGKSLSTVRHRTVAVMKSDVRYWHPGGGGTQAQTVQRHPRHRPFAGSVGGGGGGRQQ